MGGNEEQTQLGQTGLKKKCGICHKFGHNKNSCIEKPFQQAPCEVGPSDLGPSQPRPSEAAPTQPPPPSPPTQPTYSQPCQPSQSALRTTR